MGPNVKKLVIMKFSQLAIPDGGGLSAGIDALINNDKRKRLMTEATTWVNEAVKLVLQAPDSTWTTEEEAAGAILDRIGPRCKR
jgi:hypothetical protein